MGSCKHFMAGVFLVLMYFSLELALARDKEWWEVTSIYQIYPRSFKDTDGNGVGDLNGINEKLDYIRDIGLETIWIQPFYKSPMADLGYDVYDYKQIEPMFGTMDDFKRLISGIHARGMKLILDFIPNHVNDESEWFKKSENMEAPYTDFFIWQDPKGFDNITNEPKAPNNWLSRFGGPAWDWSKKRQQFYFKQFSKKQPDLNLRNPKVRDAVQDAMRFWLDMGVDGFRIDAANFLFEAAHLKNEPFISPEYENSGHFEMLLHIYTLDQDENHEVTHEWRMLMDEYRKKDNVTRLLIVEAHAKIDHLIGYFGNDTYKNVNFPFNFALINLNQETNATMLDYWIHWFVDKMPAHGVANWVMSNHDRSRSATRINPNFVDSMNMIALLLPGVVSVYNGDEIGMEDAPLRKDQIRDPNKVMTLPIIATRDPYRAPMQWDDTFNAGFTTNKTAWLPLNPDYWYRNVESQSKDPYSHLNTFKRLMKLRQSPVIRDGTLETCVLSDWVFMYVRKLDGYPIIAVIVNLGSESEEACAKHCNEYLPDIMYVHIGSVNSAYKPGDKFAVTHAVKSFCSVLRPKSGVVLTENSVSSANQSASLVAVLLLVILSIAMLSLYI